jgi:CelD/BcsL family acetyltransferase involved in cellulose biosynthesis
VRTISQSLAAVGVNKRAPEAITQSGAPAKTAEDSGLAVEVRTDLDLTPEDVRALDGLIESRPDVGVFLSPAWLSGLMAEPGGGVERIVVLFRETGVLKGIAPLYVRRTLTHLGIGFLGGGAGSDRTDLVAARGYEAACSDVFVAWLGQTFGRKAFVLELRDVPLDSPLWGALYRANASGAGGLTVQPREVHTLPYLDLAEFWSSTVDANAQLWGQSSLDKHRRWLDRRGRIESSLLTDPDEILDAFTTLREMLHARFGATVGSALDDPRAVRFHHHVLPLLQRERRLRMVRMTADGRPISVFYGLANGPWRGCYFLGYDRAWAGRIHLGRVAFAAVIERFAREGAAEFDFLKGAERVKYLWPVRTRGTLNADAYPLNMGSQLVRAGAAARDAAAALAKSAGRLLSRS